MTGWEAVYLWRTAGAFFGGISFRRLRCTFQLQEHPRRVVDEKLAVADVAGEHGVAGVAVCDRTFSVDTPACTALVTKPARKRFPSSPPLVRLMPRMVARTISDRQGLGNPLASCAFEIVATRRTSVATLSASACSAR